MITTIILLFLKMFKAIIRVLPALTFEIPSTVESSVSNLFRGVGFFFPFDLISPIISIILSYYTFKFVQSMFDYIKDWVYGW